MFVPRVLRSRVSANTFAVSTDCVRMLAATAGGEERKITAMELQHMRRKGKKISMITAYDYPSVIRFFDLCILHGDKS
jgi:hypothetical protein